jgi:hypothetical protein
MGELPSAFDFIHAGRLDVDSVKRFRRSQYWRSVLAPFLSGYLQSDRLEQANL